jgi:hypothetical protein
MVPLQEYTSLSSLCQQWRKYKDRESHCIAEGNYQRKEIQKTFMQIIIGKNKKGKEGEIE